MTFDRAKPYNDLPLLPPIVELETKPVLKQTIASARALADLRGIAAKIPNARILINGIVLQEARLSSEIENIVTSSDELYRAAADAIGDSGVDPQTKEVLRYNQALWTGFETVKNRPISTNLFVEVVSIIRQVQMQIRNVPGTALMNKAGEIVYTPPEGEDVIREKLANLEQFLHAGNGIDPLIRLAVLHYQFEAIHPFSDGNGRTGRIVNILFLVEKGLLELPVLYLSHYILKNKEQYYKGLREVTESGDWEPWILFMLKAVEETSRETYELVRRILELMQATGERIQRELPKIYSKDLVEAIYSNPYCKIKFLEEMKIAKRQTVSEYLQKLAGIGILRPQKVGREVYYINDELLEVLIGGK